MRCLVVVAAASRSFWPFATGIPAVERNEDILVGPGSCRSGFGFGPPQVGRDSKGTVPQVALRSSSRMPPPCRWPPPATSRPLEGIVKSAVLVNVEKRLPPPGTSKTGSMPPVQLRTSSQTGLTGVSLSPVT